MWADMKTMRYALLLSATLLCSACSESDEGLDCEDLACKPWGSCVEDQLLGAHCECLCGDQPDPRILSCPLCTASQQSGKTCTEDEFCAGGLCWNDEDLGESYCTPTDCSSHEDCENHAEGEVNEMCCVEIEPDLHICQKLEEGHACGNGTEDCFGYCKWQRDSACAPGYTCLYDSSAPYSSLCTQECQEDSDCDECNSSVPEVMAPVFYAACTLTDGDRKYCGMVPHPTCDSDADCEEGEGCAYTCSGECWTVEGYCGDWGPNPPGAACDNRDDCSSRLCINEICQAVCAEDEHCPEGQICIWIDPDMPGRTCQEAQHCTEDTDCPEGHLCLFASEWMPGLDPYCSPDPQCTGPNDCPAGESCWPTLFGDRLAGWCRANNGDDEVGTACEETDDDCQVFCFETVCTEWCTIDADCPEGLSCQTIDFCIAEPCDDPENLSPGTMCVAEGE